MSDIKRSHLDVDPTCRIPDVRTRVLVLIGQFGQHDLDPDKVSLLSLALDMSLEATDEFKQVADDQTDSLYLDFLYAADLPEEAAVDRGIDRTHQALGSVGLTNAEIKAVYVLANYDAASPTIASEAWIDMKSATEQVYSHEEQAKLMPEIPDVLDIRTLFEV
jgi:antirestriction protein